VFQEVIDDMYGRFVRLVAEARKIPEERVRSFADGRIYTAQQALALGLVDRIGYLDEVVDATKKTLGVDEAQIVMYHRPREYRATIYSETAVSPGSGPGLGQLTGLLGGPGPRFMYLWWP
jgi:protease-4